MEISTISARGYQINVIFVGSHYYFHSPFAGVVAIAERTGFQCFYLVDYGNGLHFTNSLSGSAFSSVIREYLRRWC